MANTSQKAPEYLTIQAAADALGVSRRHIWVLINRGTLSTMENPFDRRSKLISASEIQKLAPFADARQQEAATPDEAAAATSPPAGATEPETPHPSGRPWPKSIGIVREPVTVQSDELEDYMRERWRAERA